MYKYWYKLNSIQKLTTNFSLYPSGGRIQVLSLGVVVEDPFCVAAPSGVAEASTGQSVQDISPGPARTDSGQEAPAGGEGVAGGEDDLQGCTKRKRNWRMSQPKKRQRKNVVKFKGFADGWATGGSYHIS